MRRIKRPNKMEMRKKLERPMVENFKRVE